MIFLIFKITIMKKLGVLLTMVAVFASCSTLKVTSDYDGSVDFSKYKTYKVMHFANEEDMATKNFKINELNRKRVEKFVSEELDARGFAAAETPDVFFLYAVNIDMETSYSAHTTHMGGGHYGYRGSYYGGYGMSGYGLGGSSYTDVQENQYTMGRLRVSMIDAKTEQLLWTGSARDEIKGKKNPEEKIAKVIARIMLEFPIGLPAK